MMEKYSKSDCVCCRDNHDFEINYDLLQDFINGKVAIFAGSGISTESRKVLKFTFYEYIAAEIDKPNSALSFPKLMDKYCQQPNGRIKLLEKIKDRLSHIRSFPELEREASKFHRELATFYPQETIVTTNWDTYFEDYCEATPFVSDEDLVFWNNPGRKVLKMHGTINNYGSIIATTTDYKKREKDLEKGVLGGVLKTILATQTVVFIGFSFSDFDFVNIYNFVREQMKGLHKQAYIITPFEDEKNKFKKMGLIPIITDGTYFISQIKKHAIHNGILISDKIYEHASFLLCLLQEEHKKMHNKINCFEIPQMIYASSYQDGMMHALERALQLKKSGEYSHWCKVRSVIEPYQEMQKEKLKNKVYEDVAYIEGYLNALTFLLLDEKERKKIIPPLYFAFGIKDDLMRFKDFEKYLPLLPQKHKASYKRALKRVKALKSSCGIDFHHPPWL